jgi:hypothetical protein
MYDKVADKIIMTLFTRLGVTSKGPVQRVLLGASLAPLFAEGLILLPLKYLNNITWDIYYESKEAYANESLQSNN